MLKDLDSFSKNIKGKIEKINVPSVWERYKKDYEG